MRGKFISLSGQYVGAVLDVGHANRASLSPLLLSILRFGSLIKSAAVSMRTASMSRRGSRHDNTVTKIFFQLHKRERNKRKIYLDHEEVQRDVFNYIEISYGPKRRHGYANGFSPAEFEKRYFTPKTSAY